MDAFSRPSLSLSLCVGRFLTFCKMDNSMTHQQLIALLVFYLAIVAFGFSCERFFPLPDAIRSAAEQTRAGLSRFRVLVYGIYGFFTLSIGIAGVVGMFLRWHPAPWLFTVAIIGMTAPLSPWSAMTGTDKMRLELELFVAGFISALTLFGPAKHLFE